MSDNKVEIDVRLNTDKLDKDFDDLKKDAKAGAEKVGKAFDDISEDAEAAGDSAKQMGSRIEKATDDAKASSNKLGDSIDELGDDLEKAGNKASVFGDVLKGSLASAAIEKGVSLLSSGISSIVSQAFELDEANQKLAASTGANAEQMEEYAAVMERLYTNNYGESIGEIADAMALVKQYTGEIDTSTLETMTENAMALADTFDADMSESIRGVNALMENMGLTAEEAFDYIAAGSQNGLDKSKELSDNITEYSQLWSQAGFSAEEMFSILQNGLDSGAYNLDKVNDFVKEFTISLSDGRIEENIGSFSAGTATLFQEWQNGGATAKEVFYSVINDLASMENQQEALTIASNTWSALGEDNSMKVITSLTKVNNTYSDVKGTMESIKDVRYDTLESQYAQLGRTFQTKVATPIATKFLPIAQKGLKGLIDNLDTIVPIAVSAGTAMATIWVVNKAKKLISNVKELVSGVASLVTGIISHTTATVADTAATEGATIAQEGFNTAMNANPVGLVVTAVAGLVTGLMALSEWIGKDDASKLADEMREAKEAAEETEAEYSELSDSYHTQSDEVLSLWRAVQDLSAVENKTTSQKKELGKLVDELNDKVPELKLHYDELNDTFDQTADSIDAIVRAAAGQAAYDDALEAQTQAAKDYNAACADQKDITAQLADAEERLRKEIEENEVYYEAYGDTVNGTQEEVNTLKEALGDADDTVKSHKKTLEKAAADVEYYGLVTADLDETTRGLVNTTLDAIDTCDRTSDVYLDSVDALSQLTTAHTSARETIQTEIDETNAKIAELNREYQQAKESAYDSISSQLGMFETMPETVGTAITDVIGALQSQIDYMDTYNANLEWAMQHGVDDTLLAKLSDGSTESARILQGIVDDGGEHIADLNEKFGTVEEGKEKFSTTVAELNTNFTDEMAALNDTLDAAMKEMNKEDDAYTSGINTIQGYINGAEDKREDIIAEFGSLAEAAMRSYNSRLKINSPSKEFAKSGKDSVRGAIVGSEREKPKLKNTYERLGESALESYAKSSGWALSAMLGAVSGRTSTISRMHGASVSDISSGSASSRESTKSLAKAIQKLANNGSCAKLYINGKQFAEATQADMTTAQRKETQIRNMIKGVRA